MVSNHDTSVRENMNIETIIIEVLPFKKARILGVQVGMREEKADLKMMANAAGM